MRSGEQIPIVNPKARQFPRAATELVPSAYLPIRHNPKESREKLPIANPRIRPPHAPVIPGRLYDAAIAFRSNEIEYTNRITSLHIAQTELEEITGDNDIPIYIQMVRVSETQRKMEKIRDENNFIIGGKNHSETRGTFRNNSKDKKVFDIGDGLPRAHGRVFVIASKVSFEKFGKEIEILPNLYAKSRPQMHDRGTEEVIVYGPGDFDE